MSMESKVDSNVAVKMMSELQNAFLLFRIRLRDAGRGIAFVLAGMTALVLFDLVRNLMRIAESFGGYGSYHLPDYSVFLLILTPLAIAYTCWQEATGKSSIYPQTSTSRFMSTLMLSFFLVFLALMSALVLYGLLYVIILLLGLWNNSIILAYSFPIGFLLQGFIAAFVFLGMVTIAIVSVSFLVRSFRAYAAVPILGLTLFGVLYPMDMLPYSVTAFAPIRALLDFGGRLFTEIVDPMTLSSFLITCLAVSAIMLLVIFLVRLLIKRDRSSESISWMLSTVYIPWILIMLALGVSIYSEPSMQMSPRFSSGVYPLEAQSIEAQIPKGGGLYLDIAGEHRDSFHHPATVVELVSDGVKFDASSVYVSVGWQDDTLIFDHRHGNPLPEPQPGLENVRVDYIPPSFSFPSRALLNVAQPEIDMSIEGNTLTIRHTITGEAEVLHMPIWSMMGLIGENSVNSTPRFEISSP